MSDRVQNYIETDREREEGHVDTRSANFECDNPDKHLGCDMGIDVQGQQEVRYDWCADYIYYTELLYQQLHVR